MSSWDLREMELEVPEWMWLIPGDSRLHICFDVWLRENVDRARADWSLYCCDHAEMCE